MPAPPTTNEIVIVFVFKNNYAAHTTVISVDSTFDINMNTECNDRHYDNYD